MRLWRLIFGSPDSGDRPDIDGTRRALEEAKEETSRVRAETEKYAQLGGALRGIRQENHLAGAFYGAAVRRSTHG